MTDLPRRLERSELALLAVLAVWLVLPGRELLARVAVSDAVYVLAPGWAAGWAWAAARRHPLAWRTTWRRTSAACAAWCAGSVWWSVEQLVLGDLEPFPSWADVGFLAYPVLAVLALMAAPVLPRAGAGRLRLVLDGTIVAGSLLLLTGLGVLANLLRVQGQGLPAHVLSVAFPLADVAAGAVVLVLLPRLRRGAGPALALALALAGVVVADTLYATLAAAGTYQSGSLVDLLYAAAFVLVARAARRPAPAVVPVASATEVSAVRAVLPLLPLGVAATVATLTGLWQGEHERLVLRIALALGGLFMLRQLMLALENVGLARTLQALVAERTAELDETRELYRHRAYHDVLTELPNRAAFVEAVDASVAEGRTVAVLLLDLDGFKEVNDTHGHAVGDQLLVAASRRLSCCVGPGAFLARLGGDEFAVLLQDAGPREAQVLAGAIVAALDGAFVLGPLEVTVGGSVGHTTAAGVDRVSLLRHADVAMYAAKGEGKNRAVAWTARMQEERDERTRLTADLRDGIPCGELELHYQPVVELLTGRVVGLEALVRWRHPHEGLLPPERFLALAEASSLIVDLGRAVVAQACADVAAWRSLPGAAALWVSVNISPRHLVDDSLEDDLVAALARHGLPADALVVEVTETALVEGGGEAGRTLQRLRERGLWLALDDFGTGWSSLSRLHELPFDTVKIDRSFVAAVRGLDDPAPVLTAAVAMAEGLGLTVVAEGVETAEQLAFLLETGCARGQGFLFRRPVPADDVPALLVPGAAVPPQRDAHGPVSALRRG